MIELQRGPIADNDWDGRFNFLQMPINVNNFNRSKQEKTSKQTGLYYSKMVRSCLQLACTWKLIQHFAGFGNTARSKKPKPCLIGMSAASKK